MQPKSGAAVQQSTDNSANSKSADDLNSSARRRQSLSNESSKANSQENNSSKDSVIDPPLPRKIKKEEDVSNSDLTESTSTHSPDKVKPKK